MQNIDLIFGLPTEQIWSIISGKEERDMDNSLVKFSYKKEFCGHENAVTLDYDFGIEHCPFCGALGHYNGDIDKIEWTLPEYLQKEGLN
jgi:hypothetical protein